MTNKRCGWSPVVVVAALAVLALGAAYFFLWRTPDDSKSKSVPISGPLLTYKPRVLLETSGFTTVTMNLPPWPADASLEDVRKAWEHAGHRILASLDKDLAKPDLPPHLRVHALITKATLHLYEAEAIEAYKTLEHARTIADADPAVAEDWLYTVLFLQGIAALRRGEDENCILCRGESSCILPIAPAAVHTSPLGSRTACKHFSEYLERFPDDLEVRYLLNLAHMTLGEHPDRVEPKWRLNLKAFLHSEFDIGRFRDIGQQVGVQRLNQSGGAIMDDFDNDGLLDIVITSFDNCENMAYFRNLGDGKFEDRTKQAGLMGQYGGLNCVQTDFNNDGWLDIYIPRGAWLRNMAIRPSLLRNNGNGSFTDVTKQAGLLEAANSGCGAWTDFDNDGFLDLFLCCEQQPNRLYRNLGNGSFEEVAAKAGLPRDVRYCKGCVWFDYDNDHYPDLFLNNFVGAAQLFHNNRNGTFTEVTKDMGIDGPHFGFSCWAWDYDDDGWLDLFATSYDRTLKDVVHGLIGEPHSRHPNKLYRNLKGKGFQDVTKEAGLDMVFATMGSNFGDLDGDGFLDMYLGTGDPNLSTLVPNRLFKNVAGKRFAEISASSGTGHLQKGHGVAMGDWDRDGNLDIFIEMGGAVNGDKYHNILFQNPGNKNNWITIKLVGTKTNRAALGARLKLVTAGDSGQTIYRHITPGSSFGANPLEQTIGLGRTDKISILEVTWPTSGVCQVFRDVAVNQAIEIVESKADYRQLNWKPIPIPK